ncbi:MAG TPA: GNAT family N-acetyltransferase [Acidobacteriaceae bacterium]
MDAIKAAHLLEIAIKRIAASDTIALRDIVLRPGLPAGGSHYPGDNASDTLHLGAYTSHDNTLVAAATLCREPMPGEHSATSWRLRGMAILADYRGHGLGKELAHHCITYAAEQGGTSVWCTSRIATVPFYRALGFAESGDTFSLPQYSDAVYIRMRRLLA